MVKTKITGGLRFKPCAACGDWHEVANWPANHTQPVMAPMVIRDDMPATQSMVDGSWHESKRGIRKTYEPSGNVDGIKYVELGSEKQKPKQKAKPDRKGIRDSMAKAHARFDRGERTTDERKFK